MSYITDEKVIAELGDICSRNNGLLLPEEVVKAAKNPKSSLHDKFTWDDTEAAKQYRIIQARELIRVCVQYVPQSSEPVKVYASLSSDQVSGGGYRPFVAIMDNNTHRAILLEDALRELECFQRKYKSLIELSELFAQIGDIVSTHKSKDKEKGTA